MQDINDNSPKFTQKVYKSTIAENLKLDPPATIVQVLAEDKDEDINGKVQYLVVEQSQPGRKLFTNLIFFYNTHTISSHFGHWTEK